MIRHRLLLLLSMLLTSALATNGEESKFSVKAEKTADQRRQQIRTELVGLTRVGHEWAGEYYEGDGLGKNVSLILSPKSGYVFEWHGCMGLYDRNYGEVTSTDDRIRLSFRFENDQGSLRGIASEFIFVVWDSRKYLIPPDYMARFCNDVNTGSEPRDGLQGRYLLRVGDEKKPVTGIPKVPHQYAASLLDQPVKARIIAIQNSTTQPSSGYGNFRKTIVTLNAGKADHLLRGMKLRAMRAEHRFEWISTTKIGDHTTEAVIMQNSKDAEPQVGWELSTWPPWRTTSISIKASSEPESRPASER